MESMGVVSKRWMWVESMGVVVRRYIDFLILLIPTLVPLLFTAAFLLFVHFCTKKISFLFRCFFVIKFDVLNNLLLAQYRHTYMYGILRASYGSHMRVCT